MVAYVKRKFPVTQHVTVGNKINSQQLRMPKTTAHKILQNFFEVYKFQNCVSEVTFQGN